MSEGHGSIPIPHVQVRAHDMAMAAIRDGSIRLRPVTPPQERQAGDDVIVDVQSELRTKVLKQRRQEVGKMGGSTHSVCE